MLLSSASKFYGRLRSISIKCGAGIAGTLSLALAGQTDCGSPSSIALLRKSSQCLPLDAYRLPIIEENRPQPFMEIDGRLIPCKHLPAQSAASVSERHPRNFSNQRLADSLVALLRAHIHIFEK